MLKDKRLYFVPKLEIAGDLSSYSANKVIDNLGLSFLNEVELEKWLKNEFN